MLKKWIYVLLAVLFLTSTAQVLQAQATTKLSLTLQFNSFSGPPIANATTVLTNSAGAIIATITGATPSVTLNLPFDIYRATVTAPALNGHPAVNFGFNLPMATQVPVGITVKSFTAKVWIDSSGHHGEVLGTVDAPF